MLQKNRFGYLCEKQTFTYENIEIKKDCFAYKKKENDCDCLTQLLCKYQKCPFYREKG